MTVFAIPNILLEKLGQSGAEALVDLLNKSADERIEHSIEETKSSLQFEIERLRSEFRVEIAKSRSEIIRWTFAFIMGQFWAIVGTLFVFFKK